MAAPSKIPFRLILLLALVPCIWWALDHYGVLGVPNNIAENSLFQFRGEIPAVDMTKPDHPPLKVIYVDVDANTISHFGERPWSREYYARIIQALFTVGHAKAVGLDFVLSPAGMKSPLIDHEIARKNDFLMNQAMENFPNAFIGTLYSNIPVAFDLSAKPAASNSTDSSKEPAAAPAVSASPVAAASASASPPPAAPIDAHPVREASFPYIYKSIADKVDHSVPTNNAYPESPTYPLIEPGPIRTGMLDVATNYNGDGIPDSIPRWVPLLAETTGFEHTDNIVSGFISYTKDVTPDFVMDQGDKLMLLNPEGGQPLTLSKIQHLTFYHMSVKLALAYLGLDDHNVKLSSDAMDIVDDGGKALIHIPLTEHQLIEVNWFTKWDNNPHVSAWEVVEHGGNMGKGTAADQAMRLEFFKQFNDAIVLVGPTDPILQDVAPTPFDSASVAKVGVYGNLLKTYFTGQFISRAPTWLKILMLFALSAIIGSLAIYSGTHTSTAKFAALVILFAYILGVYEAFAHFNIVLPLVAPTGAAFSTALVGVVFRLIEEEKQKKRIKGMFGTYISPELVHKMVESGEEPKLGGEQLTISIFFSDVQGFSGFSEVLTPEKLVELMNEYLTAMTDILQAESGTLDKYIGDAVVAMFGAPIHVNDNAIRACVAACRMQKRLGELRQKWVNEGGKWPPLVHRMRSRIGLNTGPAVVGNMGSASRFNYTMMGDDVNLGARLESGAKQFGVYTMCSEATKLAAEKTEQSVLFRRLNKIIVKGRTTPVDVYDVVCLRQDATPDTLRCIELFEKGLDCYFAQKWDEATQLFAEAEKLEPLQPGRDVGVEHNPSELMQKTCALMKKDPPPKDWNGVLTMKEK